MLADHLEAKGNGEILQGVVGGDDVPALLVFESLFAVFVQLVQFFDVCLGAIFEIFFVGGFKLAQLGGDGLDHLLGLRRPKPDVRIMLAVFMSVAVVLVALAFGHGFELVVRDGFGNFDHVAFAILEQFRDPLIQTQTID